MVSIDEELATLTSTQPTTIPNELTSVDVPLAETKLTRGNADAEEPAAYDDRHDIDSGNDGQTTNATNPRDPGPRTGLRFAAQSLGK